MKFQSTLPRGERLPDLPETAQRYFVSIHAPARGATQPLLYPTLADAFQSTLPRGERPRYFASVLHLVRFQSTLPRGERLWAAQVQGASDLFQSTLPRGERPLYLVHSDFDLGFNPRSRAGSDLPDPPGMIVPAGFNPRSRAGSDSHACFSVVAPE